MGWFDFVPFHVRISRQFDIWNTCPDRTQVPRDHSLPPLKAINKRKSLALQRWNDSQHCQCSADFCGIQDVWVVATIPTLFEWQKTFKLDAHHLLREKRKKWMPCFYSSQLSINTESIMKLTSDLGPALSSKLVVFFEGFHQITVTTVPVPDLATWRRWNICCFELDLLTTFWRRFFASLGLPV